MLAIILAVIAFIQIFSDLGVSNALFYHQRVSQEELSSLYWLNVVAGFGMTLLLALASFVIADFYNLPAIQPLLLMASVYFFILSLGQQLRVLAEKNLLFFELARIELVAAATGFIVTVSWAFVWPSAAALVAGLLASSLATTVFAWHGLANGWRPMMHFRFREVRRFLSFGGYTMANSLVNAFNLQADILIGGRFFSSHGLGVYSLPRDLSLRLAGVINPIVTRVGLPVMAKVQDDYLALKGVYLKIIRMTSSVNSPIYIAMVVFSPEIVAILFGPQWIDAVPLLRILAVWGLVRSAGNPVGSLIYAVGRADLALKWNLSLVSLVLPGLWIGAQYGNQGLATALVAINILLMIPGWYFLVRPLCGAGFFEYFRQLFIPLIVALCAVVVGYVAVSPLEGSMARLGFGILVSGFTYMIFSKWFNYQWYKTVRELIVLSKIGN